MCGFDGFLGNERLVAHLKRDIKADRMSHAYIIEGARGCGKRTLATLIAAAVSCKESDGPCTECVNCTKIFRNQSPDVITVEPEKDRVQLGVDAVRKVREDAVFAPIDLAKKIFVIPNADVMNAQAQNAILKILEEPPAHVMFLILCENADNLLSTIRSRAPLFRIEALDDKIISEVLPSKSAAAAKLRESSPEAFSAAVKLARGSLGTAIELTDEKHASECLELYKKAERYTELLASRGNRSEELAFYEFSSKLVNSKDRERLAEIYSLLADALRDLANVKLAREPSPIFYTDIGTAQSMAEKFSIGRLLRLIDLFSEARISVLRNANVGLSQVRTSAAAAKTK